MHATEVLVDLVIAVCGVVRVFVSDCMCLCVFFLSVRVCAQICVTQCYMTPNTTHQRSRKIPHPPPKKEKNATYLPLSKRLPHPIHKSHVLLARTRHSHPQHSVVLGERRHLRVRVRVEVGVRVEVRVRVRVRVDPPA